VDWTGVDNSKKLLPKIVSIDSAAMRFMQTSWWKIVEKAKLLLNLIVDLLGTFSGSLLCNGKR
jgi:hypothetical protein